MPTGVPLNYRDIQYWLGRMWEISEYSTEFNAYVYKYSDIKLVKGGMVLHNIAKDLGFIVHNGGHKGFRFNLPDGKPTTEVVDELFLAHQEHKETRNKTEHPDNETYNPQGTDLDEPRTIDRRKPTPEFTEKPEPEFEEQETDSPTAEELMEKAEDVEITMEPVTVPTTVVGQTYAEPQITVPHFQLPDQPKPNPLLDDEEFERRVQQRLAQAAAEQQAQRQERVKHRLSIFGWIVLGGTAVLVGEIIAKFI